MKKLFILLLAALLIFPAVMPVAAQENVVLERLEDYGANLPQGYGLITVEDMVTALGERDVFLLDVRQPEEFEAGHIENSVSVPLRTLGENLALLPSMDTEIIVICQGGYRAMIGGAALQVLGYENIRVLKGGYGAWTGENLPTVTEATEAMAGEAPEINPDLLATVSDMLANLPDGWAGVSANDLAEELRSDDAPILLDVRSADEYATGYIRGAQLIWVNEFMANMDQWPQDLEANIVIYCGSSYRGNIAMVMMRLMGYTNVRNLFGGINSWNAAGLPLEGVPENTGETAAEFDAPTYINDYLTALPASFNALRVSELEELFASEATFTLVDVRSADEYADGFIEGAINIPLQEVTANLDLLPDTDAQIVIYCGSGHRSTLAMVALNLLGYNNAVSLMGGTRAWTSADLPLSEEIVEVTPGTAPEFDPVVYDWVNTYITNIPTGYYVTRVDAITEAISQGTPPVLVDVRTDGEWEGGSLPGAIHMSLREFGSNLDMLPEDTTTEVVFFGSTGHRGAVALALARLLGYENATALAGGTGSWTSAGFELVQ